MIRPSYPVIATQNVEIATLTCNHHNNDKRPTTRLRRGRQSRCARKADCGGRRAWAEGIPPRARVYRAQSKIVPRPELTLQWFLESDVAGPSKLDRQRVEYASTSRITRESKDARRALDDILVCAGSKPLSTLPRELVATAARACILAEDKVMAVQVARAGRKHWKQSVGLAVVSAQALEFAGEIKGMSINSRLLIIQRLHTRCSQLRLAGFTIPL